MLTINEQVHDYDCFSNRTDSNCHRGVVIYVKKYLNVTSFYTNQKRLALTRWLPTTIIFGVIGRIYHYQFECNYLKNQNLFADFSL